jgi:N-acetylglutamate synthase-like GNAT family acetyltransferase
MSHAAFAAPDPRYELRAARPGDVPALERFIGAYTGDGTLLPRTRANLLAHLGDFLVLTDGDELVGCGALQTVNHGLGEIRSLAVRPESRGEGLGGAIVAALVARARARGMQRVFCLTRRVSFFAHQGFAEVAKERFPQKIWNDCRLCPRRDACDEVAMERAVTPAAVAPAAAGSV